MSNTPLDEEFDMVDTSLGDEYHVEIPEDKEERNLDLVIELALKQYKMNVDDLGLMSPSGKLKVMEINERLLNTIKDARYKRDVLKLNRDKLNMMQRKGQQTPAKDASEGASEGAGHAVEDNTTLSRKEMFERLKLVK